jgi:tetratricopeptide (TPR) repeat protein
MAVYFTRRSSGRAPAPPAQILDRETDFKSDEIAVRQENNQDASPRSFELFRQGEELYSRGLYHEAIHVWTRILFLDRGNSEARLRIDKAKEAVAERQRRLDAEIAEALALLDSGDIDGARDRVRSVIASDGRHGEANVLAAAIDALDRRVEAQEAHEAHGTKPEGDAIGAPPAPSPAKGVVIKVAKTPKPGSRRIARAAGSRLKMAAFLSGALLLFAVSAFYLSMNWAAIVSGGALGRASGSAAMVLPHSPAAAAPDLSELRYYNGERLFSQGRYREALVELRRVDRDSIVVAEARSLILRIEDRLLRGPTGMTATQPDIDEAR